jgi:hypothetical protein
VVCVASRVADCLLQSCADSRNVEELRIFFHVSRLIFVALALWQKDAENRFFSVRNTYLFASSRMRFVMPAGLLIVFCNPVQIQETWRIQFQDVSINFFDC